MSLMALRRFELWRIRRRLRRIAEAYWTGDANDYALIRSYMTELAKLREMTGTGRPQGRALHIGSGGHFLQGWINTDIVASPLTDVVFNIKEGFPVHSSSVQWIHSEDVLEHLDQETGRVFAQEAFRVLVPGGVMRVVTPDLRAIVRHVYLRAEHRHLSWCAQKLGAETPCEAFNMHLRMNGEHRFLYDREQLETLFNSAGFKVRFVRFGRSTHQELCNLDLRNFGLSLYAEAVRSG